MSFHPYPCPPRWSSDILDLIDFTVYQIFLLYMHYKRELVSHPTICIRMIFTLYLSRNVGFILFATSWKSNTEPLKKRKSTNAKQLIQNEDWHRESVLAASERHHLNLYSLDMSSMISWPFFPFFHFCLILHISTQVRVPLNTARTFFPLHEYSHRLEFISLQS